MRDAPRLRACSLDAPAIVLEWPMRVHLLVHITVDLTRERARYVLERADKRARRENAVTSVCGSSDAVTGRQSGRVASVGHESALLCI